MCLRCAVCVCLRSVQFSSVAQSCPTLCDPMNPSTPGLPVHHQLRSSLRLMSIELVMPPSHLILCRPLLLLPPIPPSIRVFSNESALRMHVSSMCKPVSGCGCGCMCRVCMCVSGVLCVCSPVSGCECQTPPHPQVLTCVPLLPGVPGSRMCVWRGLDARLWATQQVHWPQDTLRNLSFL